VPADHVRADVVHAGREARFRALADDAAGRSRWFSRGRLVLFVAAVALGIAAWSAEGDLRAWLATLAAAAASAFLVLVGLHGRIEERERLFTTLARLNGEQAARVRRQWTAVPLVEAPSAPEHHPFASDLDVFGHASLMSLLGAVATPHGIATMGDWLLAPARSDTIAARQAAVSELAPLVDFRQELLAHATLAQAASKREAAGSLGGFLGWAEAEPWLHRHPALKWGTRILGGGSVALALGQAFGFIRDPIWLLPVSVNVVLWFVCVRRIEHLFNRAFSRGNAPRSDAAMFRVVCGRAFTSPMLAGVCQAAAGADVGMLRLQRLMELADIRLTTLVHFPLNALTLWDFHILFALERWQLGAGRHVRRWFEAVGELEALSSLAGLRHDEPDWALPEFAEEPVFEATALGHPLIPDRVRVANDVVIGPPGTFLFVTGSNMSGKSTLLRAIGVNAVLAQAGGPVCATSLRMPRVRIQTSMRVQDSLEEGVSYFMAALKRLKEILEEARGQRSEARAGEAGGAPSAGVLLYLLDELLQGTNTAERQIAVRTVLAQLLESGAIGAVTSHDLNLADAEELRESAVPVHFTEHFEEGPGGMTMTFDYRLRPGVATSRNALKLMKMIGLDR
jgi:hypothetical protein